MSVFSPRASISMVLSPNQPLSAMLAAPWTDETSDNDREDGRVCFLHSETRVWVELLEEPDGAMAWAILAPVRYPHAATVIDGQPYGNVAMGTDPRILIAGLSAMGALAPTVS